MAQQWRCLNELLEEESMRQTDEEAARYGGDLQDLMTELPGEDHTKPQLKKPPQKSKK